jgi:glycerol-3-phosphate dehydrogenase (NAD(P)+)
MSQASSAPPDTAKGIPTAKAAYTFDSERGLDLPIASEVYRVVFEGKEPEQAVRDLMRRSAHAE